MTSQTKAAPTEWGSLATSEQQILSPDRKDVSVVMTVLDEGDVIDELLESLVAQHRQPVEIIVVDGGSTDDTVERLGRFEDKLPLVWRVEPGFNISQGRNRAIDLVSSPVIACTDAGVRLSPSWLSELMAPFEVADVPAVVSGTTEADPRTTFEVALAATVLPRVAEIQEARFLPSSRSVAFTKMAWEAAGGYPEWLDVCEDLVFDLELKRCYGEFAFAPKAVAHYRPRGSLRAFFRQYYRYARGDGKADLWRLRHGIRYATYLLGAPLLVALGATLSPLFWVLALLLFTFGMLATPYQRLVSYWGGLTSYQRLIAAAWIPIIRVTGDLAKMCGYPVGVGGRRKTKDEERKMNNER